MLVTRDFVLVHVPKTGGWFLSGLVRQHCDVLFEEAHTPYSKIPAAYRDLPVLSFVRNPWDWYVSNWEHQRTHDGPLVREAWPYRDFEVAKGDFGLSLHLMLSKPELGGADYYSALLRDLTDGCPRPRPFENLREEVVRFLEAHEIDSPALLNAVRDSPPKNVGRHKPYQSYYTPEMAERVGETWVARTFGYRFEPLEEVDVVAIVAAESQRASTSASPEGPDRRDTDVTAPPSTRIRATPPRTPAPSPPGTPGPPRS